MILDQRTTQKPVISVCIANYNGIAVIDDCIQSVLGQRGAFLTEILVHDDASTDGSADYVRANYPSVKLIPSECNVGFCIANNRMSAAASGQYLLLLNNDAALYPDALQTLVAEANRIGMPAILTLPQYDAKSGEIVDRGCLLDPFFNPVPNLNPKRTDVAMVIGACLWIPKSLWDELEGFPEWFESIAEDMYLCCRARLAGYPVQVLTISGYRHWQGKSFGGNKIEGGRMVTTYRRRALSERNKTFVMLVTLSPMLLILILPMHVIALFLEATFLTISKLSTTPCSEIYAPLLPELFRNQAKLRNLRRAIRWRQTLGNSNFIVPFHWIPWKVQMLLKHGIPDFKSKS
jgi:GT2 family glycosyltransferase